MIDVPKIVPVSDLRYKHREVFESLDEGPVVLAQRSREAAVLVSVDEWRKIAEQLKQLEQLRRQVRLERSNRAFAEYKADPSQAVNQEEYKQILAAAGLRE